MAADTQAKQFPIVALAQMNQVRMVVPGTRIDALTDGPGEMELEQLYLLPELHCQGLGRLMLHHVEGQARAHGRSTLVLQTNKRNTSAIAFYRKAGSTVREEAVFDIGYRFVMDDYVMEKILWHWQRHETPAPTARNV
jgi:ribosomal protein S18 acetylase RimI-like enzyme